MAGLNKCREKSTLKLKQTCIHQFLFHGSFFHDLKTECQFFNVISLLGKKRSTGGDCQFSSYEEKSHKFHVQNILNALNGIKIQQLSLSTTYLYVFV